MGLVSVVSGEALSSIGSVHVGAPAVDAFWSSNISEAF